jgi:adenylate cyclase
VAADVVGYSRLMGRDETGTLAALKAIRRDVVDPPIAAHGGRIVKTTGDGLLLEFPSVVDAVRYAVEVQTAIAVKTAAVPEDQRIAFRVGINIGDIIIDGEDIFGDGVNVAARIEALAEPGGVCLSDDAWRQVRGKLDLSCGDAGLHTLKNIAQPVQVWRWALNRSSAALEQAPLALPEKPSVAVLPFQNMSGDPEQEYFADGVVEDIITALSHFKSLFVIARNSSFTYKGRAVDIKQVGRELGVRYVLEGSVRKAVGRVRITGQLIDAETGAHLWADRFEGSLEDVFNLQDEVTEKVIAAIAPSVERAEIERAHRKPTTNLSAHDYYLRASAFWWRGSRDRNEEAMRLLRRALEIDPRHSSAMGMLMAVYANRKATGLVSDAAIENAEVERLAPQAVRIGRDDAVALGHVAWAIAYVLRDLTFAKELIQRALMLNQNLASTWAFSGWLHLWSGDPAEALKDLSHATRLDPLNESPSWKSGFAHAYLFLDRHEDALRVAKSMVQSAPDVSHPLRIGAVCAAFAGDMEIAQEFASRLKLLDPAFRVSRLEDYLGPYRPAEFREKYKQGLLKAGLPE